MAQQWLVKRPLASSGPAPEPPGSTLPNAILGAPVITTAFATDQNHQRIVDITIGITWANDNWADVDRLIVHLLAPDNYVDTQEAFVGGPGIGETPGIVIGDANSASKVVDIESTSIMIEKAWDPDRPFVHFQNPAPTETERWRAIVVSASKSATNRVDTSPSVVMSITAAGTADVAGREHAPIALNFRLVNPSTEATTNQPYYDTAEGAAPQWGFSARWENDTKDPRFPDLGGYDLDVVYPDGKVETHASKSMNDTRHDSPLWPIGAPGKFKVRLISYSSQAHNLRNAYIKDLTPEVEFTVAVPTGPSGSEFAGNVTGFRLVNPYYGVNGSGQKALFLPFFWTKPADRAYTGCIIVAIRAGQHYPLTGLETDDEQVCELLQHPVTAESITFYCKSVSNAKVNEYDAATTPSVTVTLQPPADSTPAVSAFSATVFYAKDEFGSNTYGYSGSWTNPVKTSYPEYQGVKVYWSKKNAASATVDDQKALTGIETKNTFKTAAWPLTADSGIYLYAVSVDVNGKERPIDAGTPRQGPLFVNEQGGTISNEALPELTEKNFAQGIEPVNIVNVAPNAAGVLPAMTKSTETVFNRNDTRLYRWKQPLNSAEDGENNPNGGYKVVGTAPDLVARSLTAGYIAVGAIGSLQMATQYLDVGPSPGVTSSDDRPALFRVWTNKGVTPPLQKMVGFFGSYRPGAPGSEWEGIYALNMRIGPDFATPTLEATAAGLAIRGSPAQPAGFEIIGGGTMAPNDFFRVGPMNFDPTYSSIGLQVSNQLGTNQCWHVSRGMVLYDSGKIIAAMARNPTAGDSFRAGELVLYHWGDPNIRVLLTATTNTGFPQGTVRSDSFQCAGRPGVNAYSPGFTQGTYFIDVLKVGGGSHRIWIDGGLITGIV